MDGRRHRWRSRPVRAGNPRRSGAVAGLAATTFRAGAERFIHDAPDRPGATSALRAASEAAIDLGRRTRRCARTGGADLTIGEDIAGADDHDGGDFLGPGQASDKPARSLLQKEMLLSIYSNLSIAAHPLNRPKNTCCRLNYNSSNDGAFD